MIPAGRGKTRPERSPATRHQRFQKRYGSRLFFNTAGIADLPDVCSPAPHPASAHPRCNAGFTGNHAYVHGRAGQSRPNERRYAMPLQTRLARAGSRARRGGAALVLAFALLGTGLAPAFAQNDAMTPIATPAQPD